MPDPPPDTGEGICVDATKLDRVAIREPSEWVTANKFHAKRGPDNRRRNAWPLGRIPGGDNVRVDFTDLRTNCRRAVYEPSSNSLHSMTSAWMSSSDVQSAAMSR